jgi:transcription elongation factor B subunit 1
MYERELTLQDTHRSDPSSPSSPPTVNTSLPLLPPSLVLTRLSSSQRVTSDHRFILPRSAANGSTFLKDTLESDFGEAQTGVIKLAELRAEIVEKLAEYLMYKDRWTGSKEDPPDFQPRVQPDIALEL